jgi:hypothetical protein
MQIIRHILVSCFIIISITLSAQQINFDSFTGDDDYQIYGANQKNFSHFYFGYGLFADQSETGAAINHGKTNSFQLGLRYKRQLNSTFAFGYDTYWMKNNFNLKQNTDKSLPNNVLNDSEKLVFNNLGLELYLRINFVKRDMKMGNFLDLGAFGDWTYRTKHVTINDFEDDLLSGKEIITYRQLKYPQTFNYGVRGRIGFNRYVITGEYRFSNLFKDDFDLPELARLQIGLQIGIHR